MAVDATVTTSAEAAHYRAQGWWSDTTLSDCVTRNATSSPDKPAYIDFHLDSPGQTLTWSQFDNAATNLALVLRDLGVAAGDRVAIWHGDTAAIHVLLVAIERCGAVAVGLGARAGIREAAAILTTAGPVLLVSDAARAESAVAAAGPTVRTVTLDAVDTADPSGSESLTPVGPDEPFLINSTSGTTGLPKCVVHTQNRWHYFHQKAVANGELRSDDVFLPVIPTPFGFGIWTSHTTPIQLGATTVLIERFDAAVTCAAIERHRVTVLCCVSTQLMMMLASDASREFDLSSLRVVFTGGEPLPYSPAAQFEELPGVTTLQLCGPNETRMGRATTPRAPARSAPSASTRARGLRSSANCSAAH